MLILHKMCFGYGILYIIYGYGGVEKNPICLYFNKWDSFNEC